MIKYEVSRNKQFVFNILSIVDELELSSVLKKKITWRNDLGDDPRVGRQVLLEFNKSYPVVMSPMLEKDELKESFMEYLVYYVEIEELRVLVLRIMSEIIHPIEFFYSKDGLYLNCGRQ